MSGAISRPGAASSPAAALPEAQTPVPSPCISLCEMAPAVGAEPALCRGCLRTIDEIVKWGSSDDHYKRAVYAQIRRREAELEF
jgi:predicted Fe-S protein YdhL (DUF1289 family)